MNKLQRLISSAVLAWDWFWFLPRSLLVLALFRIVLCAGLLANFASRQFSIEDFFSDQALLSAGYSNEFYSEFQRPLVSLWLWGDSWAAGVHLLFLLGLFALLLGIGGRWLAAVLAFLHLAFLQRNYAIAYGADLIGGIFLLSLVGTQCCERLSIWNVRKAFGRELSLVSDAWTSAMMRLVMIQLSVVYMYTGWEKLKGAAWWEGTALWTVLANPQISLLDLTFLKSYPDLIALLTFMTLAFEVYFVALVWNHRLRPWVLALGVLFHASIAVVLGLWFFSWIICSAYILFLSPKLVFQFVAWLRQILRLQSPS